jgi:hypothetical protein
MGCFARRSSGDADSTLNSMALGLGTLTHRGGFRLGAWPRISLAVIALTGVVGAGAGTLSACSGPTDFTKQGVPAAGLQVIKADNNLLFTMHAGLARALDAVHCSPVASGVQWLKAGAHGSAPELNQQVIDGFARARARSSDPAATAADICAFVTPGSFRQRQLDDLRQAGLPCPNNN